MIIMKASGFAVIEETGLDVRSVSPTRRAAIVNWLVTRAHRFISSSTSDQQIDAMWDSERGDAKVVAVSVETVEVGVCDAH